MLPALPEYRRFGGRQFLEGRRRLFGPVLLDESQNRAGQDDYQDD
jgi:hypothetical protein